MKKVLGLIVVLIIVAVIIFILVSLGSGLGFGKGSGQGAGDGTSEGNGDYTASTEFNGTENQETSASVSTTPSQPNSPTVVAISVVEGKYLYQNKTISLDDFLAELSSFEEAFIVEITDDNATLRAYNKLIDLLKENSINFLEK